MGTKEQEIDISKLPESFGIEYLNTGKIRDQLVEMGFRFSSSGPIGEDKIFVEGVSTSGDGTKIRIEVTKGPNYKTPQEIALETRKALSENEET